MDLILQAHAFYCVRLTQLESQPTMNRVKSVISIEVMRYIEVL